MTQMSYYYNYNNHNNSHHHHQLSFSRLQQLLLLIFFLLLLEGIGGTVDNNNGRWKFGSLTDSKSCMYSYKASRRERYQTAQQDQLVVWLGAPSQSLIVKGKHGYLPLPTMWASFAHILYLTCVDSTEYSVAIQEWIAQYPALSDRDVILAGNDVQQSFRLLTVAKELLDHKTASPQRLKAIFHHSSSFLPHALFFGHKSFETWNDMNFWTMNRANQSVACNTKLPAVEFFLNDVKLTYRLNEQGSDSASEASKEMFEYSLSEVSTWDRCCDDVEEFANEYNQRPPLTQEMIPPALSSNANTAFPTCASKEKDMSDVEEILSRNVSVVLYSLIPHAAEIICSFYIGIYISDALKFPPSELAAIERFSAASMHTMPYAWGAADKSTESSLGEMSPGLYQQSDNNQQPADDTADLGIIFLRSDRKTHQSKAMKSRVEDRVRLSRLGAIAIFEQLLQHSATHQSNTVDIVDLITMDAIDDFDY